MKSKSTKNIFVDTNILLTFEEKDVIFEETNKIYKRKENEWWKVESFDGRKQNFQ